MSKTSLVPMHPLSWLSRPSYEAVKSAADNVSSSIVRSTRWTFVRATNLAGVVFAPVNWTLSTLGTQGSDGLPFVAKFVDPLAKIAVGLKLQNEFFRFFVELNPQIKNTFTVYRSITAAWVNWDNFVKSTKAIYLAVVEGKVEANLEANITIKTIDPTTQAETTQKFKAPTTKPQTGYLNCFKTALRCSIPVTMYFAEVSDCVLQLERLNMPLSPALSKTAALVSARTMQVFSLLAAFAATANFAFSAVGYCTNDGTTYAQFCNASLTFIKAVIKIALVALLGHLMILAQGLLGLSVVFIDIYLKKNQEKEVIQITATAEPQAAQ